MIDEGVPRQFLRSLAEVGVVAERFPKAWKGLQNGRLLQRLEDEGIECLITCDRNLPFQQTIAARPLSVLVLPAAKLSDLERHASAVASVLAVLKPGQVAILSPGGSVAMS